MNTRARLLLMLVVSQELWPWPCFAWIFQVRYELELSMIVVWWSRCHYVSSTLSMVSCWMETSRCPSSLYSDKTFPTLTGNLVYIWTVQPALRDHLCSVSFTNLGGWVLACTLSQHNGALVQNSGCQSQNNGSLISNRMVKAYSI